VTSIVIDASAFGPFVFPDEAQFEIAGLAEAVESFGAIVPQHWRLEIANMVAIGLRRNRIEPDNLDFAVDMVSAFRTEVDDDTGALSMTSILPIAIKHGLTVYDAAYVELAKRRRSILATLDKAMIRAARAESVDLFTA
jgi:predicted nucleic acid-binding protein